MTQRDDRTDMDESQQFARFRGRLEALEEGREVDAKKLSDRLSTHEAEHAQHPWAHAVRRIRPQGVWATAIGLGLITLVVLVGISAVIPFRSIFIPFMVAIAVLVAYVAKLLGRISQLEANQEIILQVHAPRPTQQTREQTMEEVGRRPQ